MQILIWILLSTFIISLISFIGVLFLALKEKVLQKILLVLVALSAGALMGGAFLHLIPEASEKINLSNTLLFVLVGFISFFFVEKVLHWRHCHKEKCAVHTFGYMNLFGDAIHNFIDGVIIAASFVASIPLGIATSIAVTLHEIGDFGVLLYSGFKKSKAVFLNFVTALTAIAGGLAGFFISENINGISSYLVSFAAGGFIYIAATDLIPEIRKELSLRKSMLYILIFALGIAIMYAFKSI